MAININTNFKIQSPLPVDTRLVLSIDEMKNIDESLMPDVYFAVCSDDSKLYIFNKNNEDDPIYGKFAVVSSGTTSFETDEENGIKTNGNVFQTPIVDWLEGHTTLDNEVLAEHDGILVVRIDNINNRDIIEIYVNEDVVCKLGLEGATGAFTTDTASVPIMKGDKVYITKNPQMSTFYPFVRTDIVATGANIATEFDNDVTFRIDVKDSVPNPDDIDATYFEYVRSSYDGIYMATMQASTNTMLTFYEIAFGEDLEFHVNPIHKIAISENGTSFTFPVRTDKGYVAVPSESGSADDFEIVSSTLRPYKKSILGVNFITNKLFTNGFGNRQSVFFGNSEKVQASSNGICVIVLYQPSNDEDAMETTVNIFENDTLMQTSTVYIGEANTVVIPVSEGKTYEIAKYKSVQIQTESFYPFSYGTGVEGDPSMLFDGFDNTVLEWLPTSYKNDGNINLDTEICYCDSVSALVDGILVLGIKNLENVKPTYVYEDEIEVCRIDQVGNGISTQKYSNVTVPVRKGHTYRLGVPAAGELNESGEVVNEVLFATVEFNRFYPFKGSDRYPLIEFSKFQTGWLTGAVDVGTAKIADKDGILNAVFMYNAVFSTVMIHAVDAEGNDTVIAQASMNESGTNNINTPIKSGYMYYWSSSETTNELKASLFYPFNTVAGETIINDAKQSVSSTYSSEKIHELVSLSGGVLYSDPVRNWLVGNINTSVSSGKVAESDGVFVAMGYNESVDVTASVRMMDEAGNQHIVGTETFTANNRNTIVLTVPIKKGCTYWFQKNISGSFNTESWFYPFRHIEVVDTGVSVNLPINYNNLQTNVLFERNTYGMSWIPTQNGILSYIVDTEDEFKIFKGQNQVVSEPAGKHSGTIPIVAGDLVYYNGTGDINSTFYPFKNSDITIPTINLISGFKDHPLNGYFDYFVFNEVSDENRYKKVESSGMAYVYLSGPESDSTYEVCVNMRTPENPDEVVTIFGQSCSGYTTTISFPVIENNEYQVIATSPATYYSSTLYPFTKSIDPTIAFIDGFNEPVENILNGHDSPETALEIEADGFLICNAIAPEEAKDEMIIIYINGRGHAFTDGSGLHPLNTTLRRGDTVYYQTIGESVELDFSLFRTFKKSDDINPSININLVTEYGKMQADWIGTINNAKPVGKSASQSGQLLIKPKEFGDGETYKITMYEGNDVIGEAVFDKDTPHMTFPIVQGHVYYYTTETIIDNEVVSEDNIELKALFYPFRERIIYADGGFINDLEISELSTYSSEKLDAIIPKFKVGDTILNPEDYDNAVVEISDIVDYRLPSTAPAEPKVGNIWMV